MWNNSWKTNFCTIPSASRENILFSSTLRWYLLEDERKTGNWSGIFSQLTSFVFEFLMVKSVALPLLGISPKELEAGTWTDMCTLKFIAALFKTVKRCKHYKCSSTWINKMWYIHTMNIIQFLKEIQIWYMLQHCWTLKTLFSVK